MSRRLLFAGLFGIPMALLGMTTFSTAAGGASAAAYPCAGGCDGCELCDCTSCEDCVCCDYGNAACCLSGAVCCPTE